MTDTAPTIVNRTRPKRLPNSAYRVREYSTLTENTPERINREQVPLASRWTPRTNSVTTAQNDIRLAERRLREASMTNAAQQMPEHVGTAYKDAVDNIIFLKRQQWLATNYALLVYAAIFVISAHLAYLQ